MLKKKERRSRQKVFDAAAKIKNQEENMNKAPRFMKEYAKYKTLNILRNELMKEEFKNKGTKTIQGALRAYEKGMITVDETMNLINNCFE